MPPPPPVSWVPWGRRSREGLQGSSVRCPPYSPSGVAHRPPSVPAGKRGFRARAHPRSRPGALWVQRVPRALLGQHPGCCDVCGRPGVGALRFLGAPGSAAPPRKKLRRFHRCPHCPAPSPQRRNPAPRVLQPRPSPGRFPGQGARALSFTCLQCPPSHE